jgi:hypothetical protein
MIIEGKSKFGLQDGCVLGYSAVEIDVSELLHLSSGLSP